MRLSDIPPSMLIILGVLSIIALYPFGWIGGGLLLVAGSLLYTGMRLTTPKWKRGKYAEVRILNDGRTKKRNY